MDTHVKDLLPAYILGSLEEGEMLLVSEHLATCPACQSELRAYQETVNGVLLSTPRTSPPQDSKARLMGRIRQMNRRETSSRTPKWWQRIFPLRQETALKLWPIMVILVVVLLFNNGLLWYRLQQAEAALSREIVQTSNPYSVGLSGSDLMPDARGALLITSDGRQAILVVEGLEPLEDLVYQMWLNNDDQIASAGAFTVSDKGRNTVELATADTDSIFNYRDFEITLEPGEGSDEPTGEKVMDGIVDILEMFDLSDEE